MARRAMAAATAMLLTCVSAGQPPPTSPTAHSQRLFRSESTRSALRPAFRRQRRNAGNQRGLHEFAWRWGHRVGQDELPDHERTATVRVKQLQEELDRSRATTPALPRPRRAASWSACSTSFRTRNRSWPSPVGAGDSPAAGAAPPAARRSFGVGSAAIGCCCRGAGFWLGYATLARRIRRKFGGLRFIEPRRYWGGCEVSAARF